MCTQSCPTLCNPIDCSPSGSSVHGIFQQEYWNRLPFPTPGDLPKTEIEPTFLAFHAMGGQILYHYALGKPPFCGYKVSIHPG